MKIKDLLFKTILSSVAGLFFLLVFLFNIFTLAMPMMSCDFFYNIGADNLSLKLSQRAYEQSTDINDLAKLAERSIYLQNYYLTDKYAGKLLNNKDFYKFSLQKNKQDLNISNHNFSLSYESFIHGNYLFALFKLDKKIICQSEIIKLLNQKYSESSPLSYFASLLYDSNLSYDYLIGVLEQKYNNSTDNKEKKTLSLDIYMQYKLSINEQKIEEWKQIAMSYL